MEEIWKDVVGYEGKYLVSNLGRIRSLYPIDVCLDLRPSSHGYTMVKLKWGRRGINKSIHRLVAEAFIPNPSMFDTVHHINAERSDNRVENLMWMSRSDNSSEAHDRRTDHIMNIEKAREVFIAFHVEKVMILDLMKKYGVVRNTISDICYRRSWTKATDDLVYLIGLKDNRPYIQVDMTQEIWRDVPETDGVYKVSNYGNVTSNAKGIFIKLKFIINYKGYRSVALYIKGKRTHFFVHRLVASLFLDNPLDYPVVHHIDNNKANNRLDNLQWAAHAFNSKQGCIDNPHRFKRGVRHLQRKLDDDKVREIRLRCPNIPCNCTGEMAKKFGVSVDTIRNVINGKIWKHVSL